PTFLTRATSDGRERRMPVGIIHGARPGERLTVFAGQHGTEYAGIEAAMRLYRELDPADVRGTVVVVMATHEESLNDWIQFAPTHPEIRDMMKEAATGSQYIINCHGGEFTEGMHPYVICRFISDAQADATAMRMSEAFGAGIISLSRYRGEPPPDPSGARAAWWLWPNKGLCDELQIPEITPEVGEKGDRDDTIMYNGILNVLRELDFLDEEAHPVAAPKIIGDRWWLTGDGPGVFFPEVEVGQMVVAGQRLGIVRDYFGEILQTVTAPQDACVMNLNVGMPAKKDGFLVWIGTLDGSPPEGVDWTPKAEARKA
ncbi:MAG: putative deacylase, partial [Thalassolituus oleivorans]